MDMILYPTTIITRSNPGLRCFRKIYRQHSFTNCQIHDRPRQYKHWCSLSPACWHVLSPRGLNCFLFSSTFYESFRSNQFLNSVRNYYVLDYGAYMRFGCLSPFGSGRSVIPEDRNVPPTIAMLIYPCHFVAYKWQKLV